MAMGRVNLSDSPIFLNRRFSAGVYFCGCRGKGVLERVFISVAGSRCQFNLLFCSNTCGLHELTFFLLAARWY